MGKTEPAEKRPDLIKPRPARKPEPQSPSTVHRPRTGEMPIMWFID
jgi:hypothetical protein